MEKDIWKSNIWGIALIVAGVVFLLANYGILPAAISGLWPSILIVVGLACIVRKRPQKS